MPSRLTNACSRTWWRRIEEGQQVRGAMTGARSVTHWVCDVYNGSDGAQTRRLMRALRCRGDSGAIAALLFRAQKASHCAKKYGYAGFAGPQGKVAYRDLSYDRKSENRGVVRGAAGTAGGKRISEEGKEAWCVLICARWENRRMELVCVAESCEGCYLIERLLQRMRREEGGVAARADARGDRSGWRSR